MASYQTDINSYGSLVLHPPINRDPEELKPFGALRFRKGNDWFMPLRLQDLELMARAGISVELQAKIEAELKRRDKLDRYLQDAQDLTKQAQHDHWQTLMGHQRVGVGFLASRERALLAFTPGLGKTATAILAADLLGLRRILVVAPLTLLPTWRREINMWSTDAASAVLGKNATKWDMSQRWTITNPEKMNVKAADQLYQRKWDLVIFDESILYKNRKAKRTKQAQALGEQAQYVWLLSGAPVAAYADDLYSQMAILRPDVFRSYWRFAEQWCILETTPWATEVVANRDPEGLRSYLRDLMISRTPQDVPGVLPETLQEVIDVDLTAKQVKLLDQLAAMVWEDRNGITHDIPAMIAQMTRINQAVSSPLNLDVSDAGAKVSSAKALIKDEIAQLPAIIWVQFQETGRLYLSTMRDAGYSAEMVYGETSMSERDALLQRFQDGDIQVLVMQLQTGKFGLSLTAANSVIYADRSYSSDDWNQSIARVRRISSQGKVVPTFILHGGFSDNIVDVILSRKLKSIRDLSLSDIRMALKKGRVDYPDVEPDAETQ